MTKQLRIRDRLFLGFGLFYDNLGRDMLRAARGKYDSFIFSPPGSKKQSLYNAVQKLLKTGYLEKTIKNGIPYLRITGEGWQACQRDFSFLKMRKKKWNRKWCVVIFDFPEEKKSIRESLRNKLYQLGFGRLQRSIYISPFDFSDDMAEFLNSKKILGYAFVLTSKHRLMGNAKNLASYVWGLEKINKEYLALLKKTAKIKIIKDERKKRGFLQETYFDLVNLIKEDPLLPYDLLPDNWLGEKVRKQILSLID